MLSTKSLGLDVLLEVLEHLPRQSDVAKMSRASKALQAASIRQLLWFGVTISNEEQLRSFSLFLSSGVSNRALHVRKLYIKIRVKSSEDVESEGQDHTQKFPWTLCETLRMTTELEDLSIDWCEEILERDPEVLDAIVDLEKLRRLQVSSVGELTASMIEDIKSPLVEVDLHCYSYGMDEPDDPVSIVRRHHGTLDRLSASYVEVQDDQTPFPRLRALALRNFASFDAPTLRKAFPNLTYLELSPGRGILEDPEASRQVNRAQQVDGSWQELEHFCGGLEALYRLGLTQAVKRVDVDEFTLTSKSMSRLHAIVRDTSPSRLLLHIGYHSGAIDGREIRNLLAVPEASSITHLVLDLCLLMLKIFQVSLMDGLIGLLSPLPISCFVMRVNKYVESDTCASSSPEKCNWKLYQTLEPPVHEALAQELAAACPQLKHISFDIMGHAPIYWTITRADGDVGVSRLEPLVGRELVHREGLWFNDRSMGLSENI